MGALEWNSLVHKHQGWRLITCIWWHGDIAHLFLSMTRLVYVGIYLELLFGFVLVGSIYPLSGLGGNILAACFLQQGIYAGASGSVFGLTGAKLAELLTNWSVYTPKAAYLTEIVSSIALNMGLSSFPYANDFAHLGGFLTGFLLGFILLVRPQYEWQSHKPDPQDPRIIAKSKHRAYQYVLQAASTALLIVGCIIGLVMLFKVQSGKQHSVMGGWSDDRKASVSP